MYLNYIAQKAWKTLQFIIPVLKKGNRNRAWKAIKDRLRRPYYFSMVDHVRKIRETKQIMDIGKYSFVNRTIKNWNQLPAETLGTLTLNLKLLERELEKQL
jgi:hypothetical protein